MLLVSGFYRQQWW